jgi:hypothetical protein
VISTQSYHVRRPILGEHPRARAIPKHYRDWYDTDITLCIGALAQTVVPANPCIVLCFDSKVGADELSSETEYKHFVLNRQFVAIRR